LNKIESTSFQALTSISTKIASTGFEVKMAQILISTYISTSLTSLSKSTHMLWRKNGSNGSNLDFHVYFYFIDITLNKHAHTLKKKWLKWLKSWFPRIFLPFTEIMIFTYIFALVLTCRWWFSNFISLTDGVVVEQPDTCMTTGWVNYCPKKLVHFNFDQ
jgi:hypothetical protein